MKKRAVCLLMSAMLAVSALSGCGNKDADSRVEEAMNSFGSAMEAGDEDAAMTALEELDNIREEEENQDLSEGGEEYPADPRWADVKPTEMAIQFNDVFIKTGMPLGEVMEEINNSDTFFVPYTSMAYDPDKEIEYGKGVTDKYGGFSIYLDDEKIYGDYLPYPQGKYGETCLMKDIPIITFVVSSISAEKNSITYRTAFGTNEDILNMSSEDVENLKETFFSGADAELTTQRTTVHGVNCMSYTYVVPCVFSWNGYNLRNNSFISYNFEVAYEEDKVIRWYINGSDGYYWDQQ